MKFLKLINLNGDMEIQKTNFDYNVGEIISVNDRHNLYKCVVISKDKQGNIYYHFKQGEVMYNFDREE